MTYADQNQRNRNFTFQRQDDYLDDRRQGFGTATHTPPILNARIRDVAPTTNSDEMPVERVRDLLLRYFEVDLAAQIAAVWMKYVIGILAVLIYLIMVLLSLAEIFPIRLPAMLTNNPVWKFIKKIPLAVWFLASIASTSFFTYFGGELGRWMQNGGMALIGVLMILYGFMNRSECKKKILMVVAGAYTIMVAAIRLRLIGISTIRVKTLTEAVMIYHFILTTVILIIDHYVFLPMCNNKN
jgi:hypothetical protein